MISLHHRPASSTWLKIGEFSCVKEAKDAIGTLTLGTYDGLGLLSDPRRDDFDAYGIVRADGSIDWTDRDSFEPSPESVELAEKIIREAQPNSHGVRTITHDQARILSRDFDHIHKQYSGGDTGWIFRMGSGLDRVKTHEMFRMTTGWFGGPSLTGWHRYELEVWLPQQSH